jgi:hypothetical protein
MLNWEYSAALTPAFGFRAGSTPQLMARDRNVASLRNLIWLYFWLLILEGALRKWTLPSLSAPLLIIRDPIVLLIYAKALRCGRFPFVGPVLTWFVLLACFVLLSVIQINAGIGGGPFVTAYGLRTYFLHLPLIFIIPCVFTQKDVLKFGKWILLLSVPMAALMVFQYLSPPGSWINATTIADRQQISFAMGKIRPPGTFSFATGAAHFFVLATTFLVYALSEGRGVFPRWLMMAGLFSIAIVQPVSGSRLLVLGCGLVLIAAILFGVLHPSRARRIAAMGTLLACVAVILSQTAFFREAIDVFMQRWDAATTYEGGIREGLVWRFFGGFLEPFLLIQDLSFFGKGIGMGTNAASAMMTGTFQFLLAEGEWTRIILEAGPFFGLSFLVYRVWIAGGVAIRALSAANMGQLLPWLLAWDSARSLLTEQTSQPTNLGFMVLVTGLSLAAMRPTELAHREFVRTNSQVRQRTQRRWALADSFSQGNVGR